MNYNEGERVIGRNKYGIPDGSVEEKPGLANKIRKATSEFFSGRDPVERVERADGVNRHGIFDASYNDNSSGFKDWLKSLVTRQTKEESRKSGYDKYGLPDGSGTESRELRSSLRRAVTGVSLCAGIAVICVLSPNCESEREILLEIARKSLSNTNATIYTQQR